MSSGVADSMLWPQAVGDDAGGQIAKLVDVARQFDGVSPSTPPYDALEPQSLDTPDSIGGSPPAVEIQVLGPVEVVGAARPFTRAWSLELVVYLAMHPGGASTDQWATHLWPNRSMAQASLHSTASAARRALGSTATGEDHLPRSHGRLVLGPGVSTDWDQFCRLASSSIRRLGRARSHWFGEGPLTVCARPTGRCSATSKPTSSHLSWTSPFAGLSTVSRIGDAAGAEWAARQGLLVSPYDERLFRILMRAADAAGNPAGVEAVMAELLRLVGDDIEPYDSVHPETYDLYRSLSRRNVPSAVRFPVAFRAGSPGGQQGITANSASRVSLSARDAESSPAQVDPPLSRGGSQCAAVTRRRSTQMISTTMSGNLTRDPEIRYSRGTAERVVRVGGEQALAVEG